MYGIHRGAERALDALYGRSPELLHSGLEDMRARQIELGNLYGGAPIRSVPSPLLLDREKIRPFAAKVRRLRRLLEKAALRLVTAGGLPEVLGMSELHVELVEASAERPGRATPIARIDGMFTGRGRFQVIEVNTDGSTGIHDCFALADAARRSAPLRELSGKYRLTPGSLYRPLAKAFRKLWEEQGERGAPRVALLDWEHVKTRYEQEVLAAKLTELGVPTVRVDPRALVRRRGRIWAEGEPVDILYKRVLTAELLERPAEVATYLEGILKGQVLQLDPFTADVVYDKGLLALIQEPGWNGWMTRAEKALVRELVPFARFYPGDEKLRARAERDQETMVLKPRTEYGGKGVVLGNKVSRRAWRDALDVAAEAGSHLIQKFVPPNSREVWVPKGKKGAGRKALHSILGVWLLGESTPGFYFRAGPSPIINVSSGAYGLPVLTATRC